MMKLLTNQKGNMPLVLVLIASIGIMAQIVGMMSVSPNILYERRKQLLLQNQAFEQIGLMLKRSYDDGTAKQTTVCGGGATQIVNGRKLCVPTRKCVRVGEDPRFFCVSLQPDSLSVSSFTVNGGAAGSARIRSVAAQPPEGGRSISIQVPEVTSNLVRDCSTPVKGETPFCVVAALCVSTTETDCNAADAVAYQVIRFGSMVGGPP